MNNEALAQQYPGKNPPTPACHGGHRPSRYNPLLSDLTRRCDWCGHIIILWDPNPGETIPDQGKVRR